MVNSQEIVRKVNFSYYRLIINTCEGDRKFFDLTQWMEKMASFSAERTKIQMFEDIIRYDFGEVNSIFKYEYAILHFTKLRFGGVPAVGNILNPVLKDVVLSADEYIAEDVSGLFDIKNSVLMLQKNIYSLSLTALKEYINYFWNLEASENEKELIELLPIMECDSFGRGKKARAFKKITLKTANVPSLDCFNFITGPIGEIVDKSKYLGGKNIEISISAGRKKDDKLNRQDVLSLINSIEENIDDFKKMSMTW